MSCNQDEQFTTADLRKLTKKEIIHLVFDGHILTKSQFRSTRVAQKISATDAEDPNYEMCWMCRHIARKLGMED